jgi:predicted nuclease of predicted toxin-antitoxin system
VIRLLLDQGLAPRTALILNEHGFDAIHVSGIGMAQAEDANILDEGRRDNRIVVTLDQDFHSHLALTSQGRPWFCYGCRVWTLTARRN